MLFVITEDNLVDYRHGKHTFIFCMFSYDNVVICLYTILVVGKRCVQPSSFPHCLSLTGAEVAQQHFGQITAISLCC